jgi:holo-[acyl-carrier protein] synthase
MRKKMILGIGNDLVDCRRIEKTIAHYGSRFLNRVFTPQEQTRIDKRIDKAAGYGKLFALKESILKALGTGLAQGIHWHDIEIFRALKQPPKVVLSGAALTHLTNQTPPGHSAHIHITVSDEWPYAQAFAMISAREIS